MNNLSQNWITQGLIDFEYKKYILLAYLQSVNKNFIENKLYPYFSDMISHYKNLISLRDKKQTTESLFPSEIKKIDLNKNKILYEKIIEDKEVMKEIENILDYSIPQFQKYLSDGKEIYEFIENQLTIYVVGVVPLYANEGYLFLRNGNNKDTQIFEYTISIFNRSDEKFRGIYAKHIYKYKNNISNTYEAIKKDLIKKNNKLPNPATFVIETKFEIPLIETLLPIAKRSLVKYIANAA